MIKKLTAVFFAICIIAMLVAVPALAAGGGAPGVSPRKFTVPVKNADTGAKVILALYKGNKLADIRVKTYKGEDVTFSSFYDYDGIKAFIWSENGMQPLSCGLDYSQIIYGDDDEIEIDFAQIDSLAASGSAIEGVTYIDPETQNKSFLPLAGDAVYYYNGREMAFFEVFSRLKQAYQDGEQHFGKIRFVKTGIDSSYDLVYVTEYLGDAVVKEINYEDKEITSYIYDEVIGFNEDGVEYVFYKEDGSKGSFDDIKKDSVLSFAGSKDGSLFSVYISNKSITGTLEEKVDTGYGYLYKIGGNYYKGNSYFNLYALGEEGVYYLNTDNTLVYQKPIRNLNYAYLFGAGTDDGGKTSVKYLKADGAWEVSELADEITLYKGIPENGAVINLSRLSDIYSERLTEMFNVENGKITAAERQLIHYKKNSEGRIDRLYMADYRYNKNYFSLDFSKEAAKYYEKYPRIGTLYIKADTKVFCVDRKKENTEDGYYVSNVKAVFKDGEEYEVNAYDTDTDGYPAIIVAYDVPFETPEIDQSSPILVVKTVTSVLNAEGQRVTKITGFSEGTAFEAECAASVDAEKLETGDVLLYSLNRSGEIDNIEVLYTTGQALEFIELLDARVEWGEAPVLNAFGMVFDKKAGSIIVLDSGEEFALTGEKVKVYTVDLNRSTPAVSAGTYGDITANRESGKLGSWVYVRFYDGVAIGAVAYQRDIE